MCEDCFLEEYSSFVIQEDFDEFDLKLSNKIISEKLILIDDNNDTNYYLYECSNCGEKWCLSVPDQAYRGFFIREADLSTKINSVEYGNRKNRNRGCFINVIILVILIYLIW